MVPIVSDTRTHVWLFKMRHWEQSARDSLKVASHRLVGTRQIGYAEWMNHSFDFDSA